MASAWFRVRASTEFWNAGLPRLSPSTTASCVATLPTARRCSTRVLARSRWSARSSVMVAMRPSLRARDPRRTGEVLPLERVRVRRIPPGDALDRRFQVIEALLLHERRELRAEAADARGLVHDHAAPGLPDRRFDRFEVDRAQRAQV